MRVDAVRGLHVPFEHRGDLRQRRTRVGRRAPPRRRARATAGVRAIRRLAALLALALPFGASHPASRFPPAQVSQGALVVVKLDPGSEATYAGRKLRVAPDGVIAFGVGRDEKGPVTVDVRTRDGGQRRIRIDVLPRDWPTERVDGVPPATVEPPPEIAERIQREQARVVAARARDDDRIDFDQDFIWPVAGSISGRFGNQRVYVVKGKDVPKSPHSGMDIAAPEGTPVKAPAAGIATFADKNLYLTGGTLLIDHGHGVSTNFLHLSRIDVKVGDRIEQGQIVGAVGKTGRATGPHLHWGLNWFDVRLDPLLLDGIDSSTAKSASGTRAPSPPAPALPKAGNR